MSFADFDDVYCICCDWSGEGIPSDELIFRRRLLFNDTAEEDSLIASANRWWEAAEREIKKERETVLN